MTPSCGSPGRPQRTTGCTRALPRSPSGRGLVGADRHLADGAGHHARLMAAATDELIRRMYEAPPDRFVAARSAAIADAKKAGIEIFDWRNP